MKINWFTPVPPAASDIANCVARIMPVLSKRADVTLWTDAPKAVTTLAPYAQIRHYDPHTIDWRELNYADHTLYNVGNDGRFHSSIMEMAHRHPGTVILHDLSVHEMALYTMQRRPSWRSLYLEALEEIGPDAVSDGERFLEGGMTPDEAATRYPFIHWALRRAHAVVVHNGLMFDTLFPERSISSLATPLPYLPLNELEAPRKRTVDGPLELVICGYLNSPNRRLAPVLEALAGLPEAARARIMLHLAGRIPDVKPFKEKISALGLKNCVKLHGYLSDPALDALLKRVHLAINLRYPTRGEASGAQLRFWNHSLPTIVTRTGWYEQLPDSSVILIDPHNEQPELQAQILRALEDYSSFVDVGLKGREALASNHSAERFVDDLLAFLPQAAEQRKRAFALPLAQRAATAAGVLPETGARLALGSAAREILKIAGA